MCVLHRGQDVTSMAVSFSILMQTSCFILSDAGFFLFDRCCATYKNLPTKFAN